MATTGTGRRDATERALITVLAVLPRSVKARRPRAQSEGEPNLIVGDHRLEIRWIGEGSLGDARRVLANRRRRPAIVVARRLSPGAREVLSEAGIGWVDETGAAEIALGSIVVSRTGRPPKPAEKPRRWTAAVLAVAESLLCETNPTVAATASATGLSAGSCTQALRFLTDLGLLEARAHRGPLSARQVIDPDRLLEAYALAVEQAPTPIALQVGVTWRDPVAGLVTTGRKWDKAKLAWAATGAAAASVLGPYLTAVSAADVYVDADSIPLLEAAATAAGLRPIEGGRLTLRPFPTVTVRRRVSENGGLRVAPWPRVYVDLRRSGVRGEEAAEHLREVVRDQRVSSQSGGT
jgi:hypothetical protein